MARIDLQLSENDLIIKDNDFVLDSSDAQHVQDTINANVGWWKETYNSGVGVLHYLKSSDVPELSRKIQLELQADGYKCSPIISFSSNGLLNINPNVSL